MPIYKDIKRNTWYFRDYVQLKNGERKQKTRSGFKTKSEAKKAETEFLLNYNIVENINIKFTDLYIEYIKHKKQKLKYQSFRALKNRIDTHILPFFKDYYINNIMGKDYIEWKDYILEKNFSYNYNSSLHLAMVNILNYAMNFYGLNSNVACKIGNFPNINTIPKINFWTLEEFNNFIDYVDDIVYYSFFTILFYTGMRLGECLALNWNDINENYIDINKTLIRNDHNNNEYSFNSPKTKKSIRTIQIDNNTYLILKNLKTYYKKIINFDDNWFVFGGIKPLSTTTIQRKKKYYCEISKTKEIRIHDFRHSHASFLVSNNLPITLISKRLGHSNISMTLNTYSHFIPDDEQKTVNLIDTINKNKKIREF